MKQSFDLEMVLDPLRHLLIKEKDGIDVPFGKDLRTEEERAIMQHYDTPVVVTHYPTEIMGFYKPPSEEDPKEAKTIYAVNKITCENILKAYSGSFNLPYTIYRICVPYDDHFEAEYSYGTIGFFLNQAKNRGTINLFGDGSLRRTFTSIEDVCKQIINSCQYEKSANQVYNIMGEEYSLKEIATLIADKYKSNITFSEWPEEHLRIESGDTVFNSEKIESEFNLSLLNSFESWLANT